MRAGNKSRTVDVHHALNDRQTDSAKTSNAVRLSVRPSQPACFIAPVAIRQQYRQHSEVFDGIVKLLHPSNFHLCL